MDEVVVVEVDVDDTTEVVGCPEAVVVVAMVDVVVVRLIMVVVVVEVLVVVGTFNIISPDVL